MAEYSQADTARMARGISDDGSSSGGIGGAAALRKQVAQLQGENKELQKLVRVLAENWGNHCQIAR